MGRPEKERNEKRGQPSQKALRGKHRESRELGSFEGGFYTEDTEIEHTGHGEDKDGEKG